MGNNVDLVFLVSSEYLFHPTSSVATELLHPSKTRFLWVTLLLQGGCDVNVTNSSGQTPLIASLVHIFDADARCKIVKQLIKAGANINKADRSRKTPLAYACALDQAEIVAILLKQPIVSVKSDFDVKVFSWDSNHSLTTV
ncbi:ankyrin repeat domain protein [Elysia marginata]|uniref:Ankyrin repeat domain protein n=1 Tax=Elysia marginata TaxID=1093978 RepID=A0AAV4IAW5_9GAST|nr:ankyrin repeat domain protein [Elysia marginata]